MKQKKAIVFFSAGIGDAILLIPLVKHLKYKGFHVVGLFNTKQPCVDIFRNINLLDELIICNNKFNQFSYSFKKISTYHSAYINYFAANRINLLSAVICSKQILINRMINSILFELFSFKIKYIEPVKSIHDAQQNLNLLNSNIEVSLVDLQISYPYLNNITLPYPFIAVQISAGNNQQTYKNWPVNYWISFLKLLMREYPKKHFVLMGDKNEVTIAEKIKVKLGIKVDSIVGKTSITEAMQVINQCELFIGLDGGLMHLAVALKKPTFSIWGPSSIILYGYERYSIIHKCISLNLSCAPCSAWICANHSRVLSPEKCPDHACTQQLMPQMVFNQFKEYLPLLPFYAA